MVQIFSSDRATAIFRAGLSARSVCRGSIVTSAIFAAFFVQSAKVASAAVFRVDDSSLTVPAILSDDWRDVKVRDVWTQAGGEVIAGEPRFSRFLARDYQFTLSGDSLRLKTTWFAGRKCVSTDEAVSSLSRSKRMALEAAFGSLNEVSSRLQGESAVGSVSQVVIWASFKAKPDVTVPVEALSPEDFTRLSPFADLAKQSFEARLFSGADCKKSDDPEEARNSARSGGRRMQPSKSLQSRTSSSRGAPLPASGATAGALPQAAGSSSSRIQRQSDDEGESASDKQRWGFLISKYVAEPGSLTFNFAGQFTRCVRAESEAAAMALMKAAYRPLVSSGGGKRTSFTVAASPSATCEDTGGDSLEGAYVPGNFEGSGSPDSSEGGLTTDPGNTDSFAPFPDPLHIDPASGGMPHPEDFDDVDLESIPVLDEPAGEVSDPEVSAPEIIETSDS